MLMSDACVFIESNASMSKDLRHLIVTEYPRRTYSYFCHTLLVLVAAPLFSAAMRRGDTEGHILGSYVTWAGPRWTQFYYTGPVSQTASQSAAFRKKGLERVKTCSAKKEPDWTAVRQVFPPVNHSPQKRSMMRDLSRVPQGGTGWKRTQCHPLQHRSVRLSIIIRVMTTVIELRGTLRDDRISGVNKTSTLWLRGGR